MRAPHLGGRDRRIGVQGQLQLWREFEASLGYMSLCTERHGEMVCPLSQSKENNTSRIWIFSGTFHLVWLGLVWFGLRQGLAGLASNS